MYWRRTTTWPGNHGWRLTYVSLSAIWFVVVFTLMLLFLRLPKRDDAFAAEQAKAPAEDLPGLTARQGFTSPAFYKLLFATVIANFVSIAIILNLIPILRWTELEPVTAAGVASLIGIFTIVGRLIGGALIDRMDARFIAVVSTAVESPLQQVAMIPMLAWIANSAPANLKATFFAVMASFTNLALSLGQLGTKYVNQVFEVTREVKDQATGEISIPEDYSELGLLFITVALVSVCLPLLAIVAVKKSPLRSA